jgi:hypothetical protein
LLFENSQENSDETGGAQSARKRARLSNDVKLRDGWLLYFFRDSTGGNKFCKVCENLVKSSCAVTSNFGRHLRYNHPDEVLAFNEAESKKRKCGLMDKYVTQKQPEVLSQALKAQLDKALVEMICLDMQPLSIKSRRGFERFVRVLAPYTVPDYRTVRNTLLPRAVAEVNALVDGLISTSVHVAVTVDMWTSRAMVAFLGATLHTITPAMVPQTAILACKAFVGSHSGENICSELNSLFQDRNVTRKVVRVLTDNGANIVKAFKLPFFDVDSKTAEEIAAEELETVASEFDDDDSELELHTDSVIIDRVSCAAHTLQLVIKRGLHADARVEALLKKAGRLCASVRKSTVDTETVLKQTKLHFLSLNVTRWNTQFMMIERLLRVVRSSPDVLEDLQSTVAREQKLTATELKHLQDLVDVLGAFNHATKILQSQTSSSGTLIPTLCVLWLRLREQKDKNGFATKVCTEMLNEMQHRFTRVMNDQIWLTCAVLDPRFRTAFCKPIEGFVNYSAAQVRRTVLAECQKAYGEYNVQSNVDGDSEPTATLLESEERSASHDDFFEGFIYTGCRNGDRVGRDADAAQLRAQFDSFVSCNVIECDRDIFEYIREYGMKDYPRLIPAWRKFLCIPATSAPVECLFSTAGDIVTQDRCRLLGDAIEEITLVKRNLVLRGDV